MFSGSLSRLAVFLPFLGLIIVLFFTWLNMYTFDLITSYRVIALHDLQWNTCIFITLILSV